MQAWLWMVLAGVLVMLELATPTFFFFAWLALGALITAIVAWVLPELTWQVQALIFALTAAMAVIAWFRFRPAGPSGDEPMLNRRAASLIGMKVNLEQAIVNGRGRARIGDSTWPVTGPDLPVGAAVTVVAVDGTRLVVTRA